MFLWHVSSTIAVCFKTNPNSEANAVKYSDFYIPNDSLINDMLPETMQLLASMTKYQHFFKADACTPDYEALKTQLHTLRTKRDLSGSMPAIEVLKNIYRFPVKCSHFDDLKQHPALQALSEQKGQDILAHGVSEQKGGLLNLLMMCISGQVIANGMWGALREGMPNMSPMCHGPYYIIYSTQGNIPKTNVSLSEVEYILVPFKEVRTLLNDTLNRMHDDGLIGQEQMSQFLEKLIDYDTFSKTLAINPLLSPSPPALIPALKEKQNNSEQAWGDLFVDIEDNNDIAASSSEELSPKEKPSTKKRPGSDLRQNKNIKSKRARC